MACIDLFITCIDLFISEMLTRIGSSVCILFDIFPMSDFIFPMLLLTAPIVASIFSTFLVIRSMLAVMVAT